jgi:hypothetical protein
MALVNKPNELLWRMIHGNDSLVRREKFTPTVASIVEWIDIRCGEVIRPPEHRKFLPEPARQEPTQAERDYIGRRRDQAQQVLRETLELMRTKGKIIGKAPKPSQINDWEKRLKAIENLEACKPMEQSE